MRFDSVERGGDDAPLLVAFALEGYDQGTSYFFDWFGHTAAVPAGDYTLTSEDKQIAVVLPEEATAQAAPGHIFGLSVRKAIHE